MKGFSLVPAALLAATLSTPALAASGLSAGLEISTLGAGLSVAYPVTDSLSVRGIYHQYEYDYSDVEDGIDYNFELDLQNASLLLDYYPFTSGFRLSGGVALNGNEVTGVARPSNTSYQIGDQTYTAAEVGTLNGTVDFKELAPYLGIGFTSGRDRSGLQFSADLGVLFQGTPDVTLNATGAAANPALASDLNREQANLQSDLEDFEFYPVLSLGLSYAF